MVKEFMEDYEEYTESIASSFGMRQSFRSVAKQRAPVSEPPSVHGDEFSTYIPASFDPDFLPSRMIRTPAPSCKVMDWDVQPPAPAFTVTARSRASSRTTSHQREPSAPHARAGLTCAAMHQPVSRPVSARPATGRTHQRRGTSVPSYVELRARTLAEQRQLAAGVKLDLVTAWDNPLAVKERYRVEHWVPPGGLYLPAGLASASDGGGGWEDEPLVTPAAGNFTITAAASAAAVVGPPAAASAVDTQQQAVRTRLPGAAHEAEAQPPPRPEHSTERQSLASRALMDHSIRMEAGGVQPQAKPQAVYKPHHKAPSAAATIPSSQASTKLSSEAILKKLQKRMRQIETAHGAARHSSTQSLRGSRPPSRGAPNTSTQLKQQQQQQQQQLRPASAPSAASARMTTPPAELREGFSFFRRDGWAPGHVVPPPDRPQHKVPPPELVRLVRARGEFGTKAPSWPMVIDISPTSLTAALLAEEDAEHQRQRERHKLAKVEEEKSFVMPRAEATQPATPTEPPAPPSTEQLEAKPPPTPRSSSARPPVSPRPARPPPSPRSSSAKPGSAPEEPLCYRPPSTRRTSTRPETAQPQAQPPTPRPPSRPASARPSTAGARPASARGHGRVPLTAAVAAQRLALALARKTGASALEVGPSLMAAFKAMDVDLSGKVTRSEFEEWVYTTGALKASGIEELFGVLDADQSGAIDYREFAQLLIMNDQSPVPVPDRAVIKTKAARLRDAQLMQKQAAQGVPHARTMSKRELQERLWSQEDAEQDVQTYMAKMKLKLKNVPMLQEANIYKTCRFFDQNGDGQISCNELGDVMTTLGVPMPPHILKKVVNAYDVNQNGALEYGELMTLLSPNYANQVHLYKRA